MSNPEDRSSTARGRTRQLHIATYFGDTLLSVTRLHADTEEPVRILRLYVASIVLFLLAAASFTYAFQATGHSADGLSRLAPVSASATMLLLWDLFAVAGVLASAGFFAMGLVRRANAPKSNDFCIGTASRCVVPVHGAFGPRFSLVYANRDHFVLRFHHSWHGSIAQGAQVSTLQEATRATKESPPSRDGIVELPILEPCTIVVQTGTLTFHIQEAPRTLRLPGLASPLTSPTFVRYTVAGSASVVLAALTIASMPDKRTKRTTSFPNEAMTAQATQARTAKHKDRTSELPQPAHMTARRRERKNTSAKPPYLFDSPVTEKEVRQRARRSGILSAPEPFALIGQMLAKGEPFDASDENIARYGTFLPADMNLALGTWGYDIRKMGPGSGDQRDWGTQEVRPYTLSSRKQTGLDYEQRVTARRRVPKAPFVRSSTSLLANAGISNDALIGHIGMKKRRLRECFNSFASSMPKAIAVDFAILPSGTIGDATARGFANPALHSCLREVLESIQLPKTKGRRPLRVRSFDVRL